MSNPQNLEHQTDSNSNNNNDNINNNSNSEYPKYKGVRKRKWGKWVSEIRMPNSRERIWLGSFDCPRKAARAFDAAQFCLRGPHAGFNFPESLPDIPGGASLSPHQIQAVATLFANGDENVMGPPQTTTTDHHEAVHQNLDGSSRNEYMDCSFMDILDNHSNTGFDYDSFDHYYNISGPLYTMHSSEDITNYGDYDDDPHYYSHQSSSLWNF